jgi:NAD(P)H-dependent flavin oxidoreductase YrpB (nitropropane dioxygenase family)
MNAVALVPAPARKSHRVLRTRICELLGIDYPIVQTGMGWVSGARLTSATSAAGGLGILASATMTVPELERAIRAVKERTDRPFGVNLRADQPDVTERINLMIEHKVRVASFAQAPSQDLIRRLKDAGIFTMPTIGARRHAEKVAAWGVDAVIAQGHEGGGHTGEVPTTLLLPQVCDAVDIPVVAAGGFCNGRGLIAALAYGASGVAMGTRFLLTQESTVPDAVKNVYLGTQVNGTIVTRSIDGYPQRVIKTDLIARLERASTLFRFPRALWNALRFLRLTGTPFWELVREGVAMKKNQDLTWSQVAMAANAPMLTKATMVDGRPEVGILPTGQVVGVIDELPTVADLIARIMREAEQTLDLLAGERGSP